MPIKPVNNITSPEELLPEPITVGLAPGEAAIDAGVNAANGGLSDPLSSALIIFALACFVGYFVVWNVTPALHTPLMSVTNAISGIIVIGAILGFSAATGFFSGLFGAIAILIATVNIVGGFAVTARMLAMYKKGN